MKGLKLRMKDTNKDLSCANYLIPELGFYVLTYFLCTSISDPIEKEELEITLHVYFFGGDVFSLTIQSLIPMIVPVFVWFHEAHH